MVIAGYVKSDIIVETYLGPEPQWSSYSDLELSWHNHVHLEKVECTLLLWPDVGSRVAP